MLSPNQYPFSRITVEFAPLGGTYVTWELDQRFVDPMPYVYQLQYSEVAIKDDTVWNDVGPTMEDAFMAVDDEQRVHGLTLEGAYRLVLVTPKKRYVSGPITAEIGAASWSAWRLGQEMVRAEMLKNNLYFEENHNLLLRAKRFGPPCTLCANAFTGAPSSSKCLRCFGTGFDRGYFTAVPISVLIEHSEASEGVHGAAPSYTAKNDVANGRFTGLPIPQDRDIIVEYGTNRRWYVGEASGRSEIGTYIVSIGRQLKLINFDDTAYKIPTNRDE